MPGSTTPTRCLELDAMTVAYYRAMEIRSEILLPITIEGRWIGSVGFISADRDRVWTDAERGLLRYSAEMIGAYWERRDARARLEELLAAKDEFIASVSHEIRTPLTAVVGFASELRREHRQFLATRASRPDLTDGRAEPGSRRHRRRPVHRRSGGRGVHRGRAGGCVGPEAGGRGAVVAFGDVSTSS